MARFNIMIIDIFKVLQSTSAPQEQKQFNDRLFPILDGHLREDQASFGPGDSCVDHINTLCIIIVWQAFDSMDRAFMWTAQPVFNVSAKLFSIIKSSGDIHF